MQPEKFLYIAPEYNAGLFQLWKLARQHQIAFNPVEVQQKALLHKAKAVDYFADKEIVAKLNKINTYLKQNNHNLCYYAERKQNGLLFTSHVAESTVEHLTNGRHKWKQKMQWTCESAHHVLQKRAAMASNDWCYVWEPVMEAA